MKTKKKKIFIALDTNKISKAKKIIKLSKTNKLDIGYKVGLELFFSKGGREFVSKIKNKNLFLDLKISDIETTSSAAIRSLKDLRNVKYLTVHASSGEETLRRVVKTARQINSKLRILIVTILTSISNSSVKKIGHTRSIQELVKKQALLAKKCKAHGIVCAGPDLKFVRKVFKGEIFTPGIRLKGSSANEQKRILGPKEAFKNGATALVIGRSITKKNVKKNIKQLIEELK